MHSLEPFKTQESTWIEQLALDEITMNESGVVRMNDHLDPLFLLEESSINFVNKLRDLFELYVSKFNQYRGQNQNQHIKIFKISNTANDFMLYRNSLKLIVSRQSTDLITVGFMANTGSMYSARVNSLNPAMENGHQIKAQVGAFDEITWRFQGEIVNPDIVVKHYLTEFIKHTGQ